LKLDTAPRDEVPQFGSNRRERHRF